MKVMFNKLNTGDAFKHEGKLYIKLNLPIPCALDVKDNKGKVKKFKEDEEVEKKMIDISIINMI